LSNNSIKKGDKDMPKTIKAKYKNGIFEPLETVEIKDGTEINIMIFENQALMSEEEKLKRFLSSAGSWKDYVDESFLDEIYEQRKSIYNTAI
jgi:predicted DNA-binding antitoxin AbrB/MazE fold protein